MDLLCVQLHSDISYSHIPIILLTAKTDLSSKIEGMNIGADAYVEKPFSTISEGLCAQLACFAHDVED